MALVSFGVAKGIVIVVLLILAIAQFIHRNFPRPTPSDRRLGERLGLTHRHKVWKGTSAWHGDWQGLPVRLFL